MAHWTEDYWSIQPTDNRVRERALAFNRLMHTGRIKYILMSNNYNINSSLQDIHDAISSEGAYTREDLTWAELDRLEDFIKHRIKEKIKGAH